jgi:enterochelin esterase-like enzyme
MIRQALSSLLRRSSRPPGIYIVQFIIAMLLTSCCGALLLHTSLFDDLSSLVIQIGLDPLRAQLIAALIMTLVVSLLGASLARHRSGAILGGGVVFYFGYLAAFIGLEQQPSRDPGGNLQPLVVGALIHTSLLMLALALLCAFIGAVVGGALGEILLDPAYRLLKLAWHYLVNRNAPSRAVPELVWLRPTTRAGLLRSWLGAAMLIVLVVLASESGNLFLYSPDTGLHTGPALQALRGLPDHGTIVHDSVISPALGGQSRPFLVYLPPSYSTPQGRTKRYPTLYLLHGSPGSALDWFAAGKADQSSDALIARGNIPELLLVSPDGTGRRGQTSEWGNSGDGRQLMETFVAADLVHYVDQKYRTLPAAADRGIAGLSMGGFGAMNIALHHPGVFGSVIALGGYYRAEGSIWGQMATSVRANSPLDVLPNNRPAWRLHFYLGAATKDQPYYADTMAFVQALKRLHISYQLDIQQGFHAWKVWQVQLYHALLWLRWG